LSVTGPSTVQV